ESQGCPFAGRCLQNMDKCRGHILPVRQLNDDHFVRCYLYE
ncbi:MAG: peptide/nickel transport system ATP-binding protein, partial [Gammaproteobacteria bacterium]